MAGSHGNWLRRVFIGGGVLLAFGLLVYGVLRFTRRGTAPSGPSPEAATALIHSKNVGLGHLENQKLPAAIERFDAIARELPNDPLAWRNLAVARVLQLGGDEGGASPEDFAQARAGLEKMHAVEGDSIDYHWLATQVALAERNATAAEQHLNAILESQPDDAAAWYALHRARRLANARATAPDNTALVKAWQASPRNAWLLMEWLRAKGNELTQECSEADTKRLVTDLETARATLQPFIYVMQTHSRVDPNGLLDGAVEALGKQDCKAASLRLLSLANVLLPYAAADQGAIRPHPLDFIRDRFAEEFYASHEIAEAAVPAAIAVELAPFGDGQLGSKLFEELGTPLLDVALADMDLDGQPDLVLLGSRGVGVFRRDRADEPWEKLASFAAEGFEHLLVQDFDADFDETALAVHGEQKPPAAAPADRKAQSPALANGCPSADADVVLYGRGGVQLLENRFDAQTKSRTLVAPAKAKLPELGKVTTAVGIDLEADGDLDLALVDETGIHLWAYAGEWEFADITARSHLPDAAAGVTQLLAVDWDRDVDLDLMVASGTQSGWLENVRHGQFRWHPWEKEAAGLASLHAVEVSDADSNASWDLIAAGDKGVHLLPTRIRAGGGVQLEALQSLSAQGADRVLTWDYDNDGFDDLLAWSAEQTQLLRGAPAGRFSAVDLVKGVSSLRQATAGDLDGDGDLDLALLAAEGLTLLENRGGNQNHWLDVALQAQQIKGQQHSASGRVNPFGVGCLVELKAGPHYQAKLVRNQTTHFGLGQHQAADVVRVVWLNGVPQNIVQVAADLFVCEQQVLNTSCPYLYTWNGEQFVFATDLLWAAPLGLQFAEGVVAPAREWEYLKIPGNLVAPRKNEYVMQMTEELWEAAYLDEMRLIAVDHPAEVAIYSNEKVGPAELAEHKIHTVQHPRAPRAAVNHNGRNLLPEIVAADDVYARTYDRKLRQGVTENHYFELDLGDLANASRVTLFLTGWVYPPSTSINVALSQGGSIAPALPPSLHVPDGNGGWQEALAYLGFPGGKTKTIAVDLSEVLRRDDARVRIHTSMELYWDQIFFTVDEAPAPLRTHEVALLGADLHERGYSRVVPDAGNGPERFLYDELSTLPKWPPMQGGFTPYGEVAPLLHKSDNRLLVIGAGDEVTLRFAVPGEPLPPGWRRDFLLYSVGWDKDANLLTVLGEVVEPLPFRAMSRYPWPDDEPLPAHSSDEAYLRGGPARRQSPGFWTAIRRYAAP
jgi:tetratricopeptide (TPR) repeat protein